MVFLSISSHGDITTILDTLRLGLETHLDGVSFYHLSRRHHIYPRDTQTRSRDLLGLMSLSIISHRDITTILETLRLGLETYLDGVSFYHLSPRHHNYPRDTQTRSRDSTWMVSLSVSSHREITTILETLRLGLETYLNGVSFC